MSSYPIRGLVNNINILNMVAVSLLQVKKWRWGKLSQISQGKLSGWKLSVTLCSVKIVKMILRHKKSCRYKLTLLSVTLMFREKEKFSVFHHFFDQWNFSLEDIFQLYPGVHSKLWHITVFLNIECKKYKNLETKCVTTSPGLP